MQPWPKAMISITIGQGTDGVVSSTPRARPHSGYRSFRPKYGHRPSLKTRYQLPNYRTIGLRRTACEPLPETCSRLANVVIYVALKRIIIRTSVTGFASTLNTLNALCASAGIRMMTSYEVEYIRSHYVDLTGWVVFAKLVVTYVPFAGLGKRMT